MPKKIRKVSELKGLNIYQDPKKGTVLYDFITKKGFQLTTSDIGGYSLSQAFFPVAIVLVYILYQFVKLDMVKSVIISVIAYIAMRLIYRFEFLNKLPYVENYQLPDNGNIFINAANKYPRIRLILLAILAVALVGVTIAYLLTVELGNIERIGIIVLIIGSFALLLFSLITLSIQKQKNN